MVTRTGLYKGYSSFEFEATGSFKIIDIELVKLDLLNHIFTRRGERVHMPRFGTTIPDLVFEPLDEETLDVLEGELTFVFEYDPRVELLNLDLIPDMDNNSVTAAVRLLYVELDTEDLMNLNIQFESEL